MDSVNVLNIVTTPQNGLKETIKTMNLFQKYAVNNAAFVSWVYQTFSTNCNACLPGKVWKYIQNNFEFVYDVPEEKIIAPYILKNYKKGDCDDFALFAKTVIDLIGGWHTRYILFGRNNNEWTHIAVFCYRDIQGNKYIDDLILDGTNSEFNSLPSKYKFYKLI